MHLRLPPPVLVLLLALSFTGCGEGVQGPRLPSDASVDGTIVAPPGVVLLGIPVTGSVSSSVDDVRRLDVPAAGLYALVVDEGLFSVDLAIYGNSSLTQTLGTCTAFGSSEVCLISLPAQRVWIRASTPFWSLSSFEYKITHVVNEGTAAAPVPLVGDGVLHAVGGSGQSFYTIPVPTAGSYRITYWSHWDSALSSIRVGIYEGGDFGAPPRAQCTNSSGSCDVVGVRSGVLGIRVDSLDVDPALFELSVERGISEGATAEPVELTVGVAESGAVDSWARSFYAFTTTARAGGYRMEWSGLGASVTVRLYDPTDTLHTELDACSGVGACELSGLEANRRYAIEVDSGAPEYYDLTVREGGSVGTPTAPVPLTAATPTTASGLVYAQSFYSFTPTTYAYYELMASVVPVGADVRVRMYTSLAAGPTRDCYVVPCDLGALDAGTTYYFTAETVTAEGEYTFDVHVEPLGEGTRNGPVLISLNQEHVGTLHEQNRNYYAFDTDATGGRFGVVLRAGRQLSIVAPIGVQVACPNISPGLYVCTFQNTAPNTRVTFDVSSYPSTGPTGISLRLYDLDRAAGCEPDSTRCVDFESGVMPAGFTEPASGSSRPWRVTTTAAIRGTYGFEPGTMSPTCFEFVTGTTDSMVAYSFDVSSTSSFDTFQLSVDGTNVFTPDPYFAATGRNLLPVVPGSAHAIRGCFAWNTTATRRVFLDDISTH